MSVQITNFVKINIKNHEFIGISGSRPTSLILNIVSDLSGYEDIECTKSDYKNKLGDNKYKDLLVYANIYFDNGGNSLKIIFATYNGDTDTFATNNCGTDVSVIELIKSIPVEYVVMTGLDSREGASNPALNFKNKIELLNNEDGVYHKIFVEEYAISKLNNDFITTLNNSIKPENYVIKFGDKGISATVLAYYSKIDIYKPNVANDYTFTLEKFTSLGNDLKEKYYTEINSNVVNVINNNLNIDAMLDQSNIRNIGGNDIAGQELTNQYMLILLHQTLSQRLLQVLINKIKYNDIGVATILGAINQELNRYVNNGYLYQDKIWRDSDLYYKNTLIINENTPLTTGYKVVILPFSTLEPDDIKAHKLPDIYILIGDSYFIRQINITGEVF